MSPNPERLCLLPILIRWAVKKLAPSKQYSSFGQAGKRPVFFCMNGSLLDGCCTAARTRNSRSCVSLRVWRYGHEWNASQVLALGTQQLMTSVGASNSAARSENARHLYPS